MSTPTTVSVDNDLTTSNTSVTLGSTDDETARRLQVVDGLIVEVLSGDNGLDDVLQKLALKVLKGDLRSVLGGDDDGVDPLGNGNTVNVLVLNGDLGLRVRAEPAELAVAAELRHLCVELVGQDDGEGHQLGGFVGGVSEHNTLVTGTNLLDVFTLLDETTGNVGGLLLNSDEDVTGLVVET